MSSFTSLFQCKGLKWFNIMQISETGICHHERSWQSESIQQQQYALTPNGLTVHINLTRSALTTSTKT